MATFKSLTGFLSSSFVSFVVSSASRFRFELSLLLVTEDGGLGGDTSGDTSGIGVDSFEEPLDNLLPDCGVSGTKRDFK